MRRALPLLLALAALLAPTAALAQEEEVRALAIRSGAFAAWASAQEQWLVFDLPFAGLSTTRNGSYREGIEVDIAGSVYHPNLVTFVLDTRLGLAQWEGSGTNAVALPPEVTADIHFLTTWLQKKPVSFSLYADRRDNFPGGDILSPAQVTQSALGGFLQWSNPVAPFSLSMEKNWREETRADWSSADEALVLRTGVNVTAEDLGITGRADYAYTDFSRAITGFPGQAGRSHDARLAGAFAFGGGRHRLSSNLRFMTMEGTLPGSTAALAGTLDLGLPWGLSTQASYNLLGTDSPPGSSVTHQGSLLVKHQLFESLTTTLGARGSLSAGPGYSQAVAGPSLDLRYRKNVGIGFLDIGYALTPELRDRQSSSPSFTVTGERHVLEDGTVTFLDHLCVDPSAIVVTDEAGITEYLPGVDYEVTVLGGRLQVRRVPGGRIASASAVLVTYTASSDPSSRVLALSQEAGLHLALFSDRLSLSYRYRRTRYPSASGAAVEALDLVDDHRAAVGLDLSPFTGTVEYEHFGSSALPFDALRLQQGLSWTLGPGSSLSFQGNESLAWFASAGLQGFVELTARGTVALTQSMDLSGAAGWRLQVDAGAPSPSSLWSAEAAFAFHQGKLQLEAAYRFSGPGTVASLWDHSLSLGLERKL